jgi:hypothetical protein
VGVAVSGIAVAMFASAGIGRAAARPSVSGALREGRTLEAAPRARGTTYQWQRCSLLRPTCTNITGATGSTYTLDASDVGTHLRVRVGGNASSVTEVIRPGPPVNSAPPRVHGAVGTGRTVGVTDGSWRGTGSITIATHQWMRCTRGGVACRAISGANQPTYQVTGWDYGHRLRVIVRARNAIGDAAALSGASGRVHVSDGTADFATALLTGGREYGIVSTASSASVRATTGDGNVREIFWPRSAAAAADAESCATWSRESSRQVQQGAALRIRAVSGGHRAITVTKNVFFGANWIFNFHGFDSSRRTPYTLFGQVNLSHAFAVGNAPRPLPWHLCARTRGSTVEFKVWRAGRPEPAYGTPGAGGSARLPSGWSTPGRAGWYVGHLPGHGEAVFEALRTN